jgi:hypothetical protein
MRRMLPIYLAAGASLGVILAYLLAGGASYKPLAAADPCAPRSVEILAERGLFEAIALSALDGAACELEVSREELTAALGDPDSLAAFAEANDVDEARIVDAIRAGLIRAVDDAERDGRLSGPLASVARGLAENAPVPVVIDLFQALPGDPTVADLLSAVADLGVGSEDLPDLGLDQLNGIADELNDLLGENLGDLLPEGPPQLDPGALEQQLPEGLSLPGADQLDQLRDRLDGLLGGAG